MNLLIAIRKTIGGKVVKKTIVVGLDGAHFELINPWINKEELPNIKKCIENGAYGDLEVCLPPVTSPNWKCYSTGKNPGKLGIFWWENIDIKNRRVYFPAKRKMQHKEIWDYLSESGYKVAVIGMPLTYPPKKVNGIIVAGGPDCPERGFTYPKKIEKILKYKYKYKVHPKHKIDHETEEAANEILEIIESRFRFALDLINSDEYDFIQVTTFYLNVLQHFLWDSIETKKAWKIIDNYIGKFTKRDVNIIFMSDHGSNRINVTFNINSWLYKEGYLKYNLNYRITKFLANIGVTQENIMKLLDLIRIKPVISRIIPENIKMNIPINREEIRKEGISKRIDWDRTVAIASGQGPIYLLKKEKKEEIKRKILELKAPNGQKIAKNVYEKKEIYSGEYLSEAPDLIVDQESNVLIKGGIGKKKIFESAEDNKWKAENKKYGLFIAYGPSFRRGKVQKVSILDLAPTILKLYGIEKPPDMDGRVLEEILK